MINHKDHPKNTRLLLKSKGFPKNMTEVTILEWSPSNKNLKVLQGKDYVSWWSEKEISDYEVVEVLNEIEEKGQFSAIKEILDSNLKILEKYLK